MSIILACAPIKVGPDDIILDHDVFAVYRRPKWTWLSPRKFRVLTALLVRSPHLISTPELVAFVYEDEDGGPLTAAGCIDVALCHLRPLLTALGFSLINEYGRGWVCLPIVTASCVRDERAASSYSSAYQLEAVR